MSEIKIRYSKDGDIESYDPSTEKTTGHISTMGNFIEPTKEDIERDKRLVEEIEKKLREGYDFSKENPTKKK
ncbi:MAG: hypothetical protein MJZ37_06675 [Bacilli bacterium]|nr:hypothetical protein [Bacilli bacterium]